MSDEQKKLQQELLEKMQNQKFTVRIRENAIDPTDGIRTGLLPSPGFTGGHPEPNISPYTMPGQFVFPARISVPNKKVAVEPFPATETKVTVKGGVMVPINQASLTPLKVVFDSDTYKTGFVVFVKTKLSTGSIYAKEVFEAFGERFILIPEEEVILVDRLPAK